MATDMAHAHNTFLRSLNSIYHQAPHVSSPSDIRDILFYGRCWYDTVEHHHHHEETGFFPDIEKIAKKPGLMERNAEQHHAFHPGFYAFRDYCLETKIEEYDGMILMGILDDFSHILQQHLAEEIETLLELSYCDESQLKKAYGDFEASIIAGADSYPVYPMVMGTIDDTYEDGMHKGLFPPTPWFVPYLIKY